MFKNIFFNSAFFLLSCLSVILIVSNLFFLFNFDINIAGIVISLLIAVFLLIYAGRLTREVFVSIFVALLISVISYYLAITFFDTSWDGQGYHQETIYLLKNGWNPIYEESHAFRIWVNLYQKGNEIIQANIYLITNKIEAGKMLNIILIYIAFVVFWTFLDTLKLKNIYKFIISFVVVFNPVVFTQVFTYYIDGNWYLTLLISLAALLTYFSTRKLIFIIIFVLSSVVFCSLKFSSIPVFIVFSFFALAYHYIQRKKILVIPYLAIFLLVGICNVHPFIKNVQNGDHIFYPFIGEKKIDIINQNIPTMLLNKNRVERTLISLFSETNNDMRAVLSETLKFPFTVHKDELYINYDTRLGGFGFLFSGIIIMALLVALYSLLKADKQGRIKIIIILSAILCSILINPASWWARLSPQIWLFPVIIIIFGLLSRHRLSKIFSQLALVLLMINVTIPGFLTCYKLHEDNKAMNQFVNSIGKKTIILDLSHQFGFQQYYLKFKERNVKYKIDNVKANDVPAPFTPDIFYEIK